MPSGGRNPTSNCSPRQWTLTLVLDNEYDAEEEHVIGGHIATVYTYVDGYAMAYYEADNYVYVITADHMTAEEMFQLIASMDI